LHKLLGNEKHEIKNQKQSGIEETKPRSTRFLKLIQLKKVFFLKQKAYTGLNNQLNSNRGPNIQYANETEAEKTSLKGIREMLKGLLAYTRVSSRLSRVYGQKSVF